MRLGTVAARTLARGMAMSIVLGMAGCASIHLQKVSPDEAPLVIGPMARPNRTPLEGAYACMARQIRDDKRPKLSIAVGDVKDYTGKYSQDEGSTITQGGALMVYSALGKLDHTIRIEERFDTRIAELELAYTDKRQLGDGQPHSLDNGKKVVPWLPYFGGTILRSDYYIVGGITELNYDIQSGGAEFYINNLGPKARVFTMNIGVDLRIVDTRTLVVVDTVSLEKQITGYEIGFNIFRFFGTDLYDVNIGNKAQEPLQLGVRTVIEQGVLDLIGTVENIDAKPCLDHATKYIAPKSARDLEKAMYESAAPVPATPGGNGEAGLVVGSQSGPAENEGGDGVGGGPNFQVAFDFGQAQISGESFPVIDHIVQAAAKGAPVDVTVIARDTENWAPDKRQDITNQRIKAIVEALSMRGIAPSRVQVTWMPSSNETGIVRDGAGFQVMAKLEVTRS